MKTAYINGIILDGTKDMVPQTDKVIITEGKNIVAIEDKDSADLSDCKLVDLENKYILPGLINLHAHIAGSGKPTKKPMNLDLICKVITSCELGKKIGCKIIYKNVYSALMGGVTTIRAVGGIADLDTRVRDDIIKGKIIGPHILSSNCAISVPGGHMAGTFAYIANSKEEAAAFVDKISAEKPDLIKLMVTGGIMDGAEGEPGMLLMPAEYIKAACDRAHELGYKVAAHCEGKAGILAALQNGVDTIEHGAMPDDGIMNLFNEKKACQVLTIAPALPYVKRLPGLFNLSETAVINSGVLVDGMICLAKKCLEQGIPVGLGTDSGCSYATQYGFWREMAYFAKYCNVSNQFALHTGTLVNARIAGIDDITGSIEVGKRADMIVAEKNPLEDLSALDKLSKVIFEGKCYDNPDAGKFEEVEAVLDEMLRK